jgi:hypothetical protein
MGTVYVPTEARIIEQLGVVEQTSSVAPTHDISMTEMLSFPAFIAKHSLCVLITSFLAPLVLFSIVFAGGYGVTIRYDTDNYRVEGHPATLAWDKWLAAEGISEKTKLQQDSVRRRELFPADFERGRELGTGCAGYLDGSQRYHASQLSLVYEAVDQSNGNLLQPETLRRIMMVERWVRQEMTKDAINWRTTHGRPAKADPSSQPTWADAHPDATHQYDVDSILNWMFPRKDASGVYIPDGTGDKLADVQGVVSWLATKGKLGKLGGGRGGGREVGREGRTAHAQR